MDSVPDLKIVNKEKYNDQLIIQYLLGSLSEDEVEKIEELSFIDGDFAVRVNAVENDLVDAYVNGGLSGDTLERFATSYLASPRRRTKVKTAETLRAYARKEARQELQAVFAPDQPLKRERSLTRPPFPFRRFALTAAAVLVSLLAGWLLFEVTRLRTRIDQAQEMIEQQRSAQAALEQELRRVREEKEQIEEQKEGRAGSPSAPANPKITTFLLTMPARAADRVQEITIPSGTDYVLLRAVLEPDDYPSYNAELLSQPGLKPVGWKREKLRSRALGESKAIDIIIPTSLFRSREYLLAITGVSDSGVAEGKRGYPFKVLKQ